MPKLIIANWKMNPASETEAVDLAKATDNERLVICPPFPFLKAVGAVLQKAILGAQDVFGSEGARSFTGEVSAEELKDMGVHYVIIGHSERRKNFSETNEMISRKIVATVRSSMTPILCVGETWESKTLGTKKTVLTEQLKKGLAGLVAEAGGVKNICIAYEPVWAISTNLNAKPDTPEDTVETIKLFKEILSGIDQNFQVKFLYGGSVTAKNAEKFLAFQEIKGALVGGASLKPKELQKIIALASTL